MLVINLLFIASEWSKLNKYWFWISPGEVPKSMPPVFLFLSAQSYSYVPVSCCNRFFIQSRFTDLLAFQCVVVGQTTPYQIIITGRYSHCRHPNAILRRFVFRNSRSPRPPSNIRNTWYCRPPDPSSTCKTNVPNYVSFLHREASCSREKRELKKRKDCLTSSSYDGHRWCFPSTHRRRRARSL